MKSVQEVTPTPLDQFFGFDAYWDRNIQQKGVFPWFSTNKPQRLKLSFLVPNVPMWSRIFPKGKFGGMSSTFKCQDTKVVVLTDLLITQSLP